MFFIAASTFLKALGWALVNSIWQFALCWLLYCLLNSGGKLAAASRHTAALCLLFSGTVFFIIEFSWKYYGSPAETGLAGNSLIVNNTSWYNGWHTARNLADMVMPYWSLLYLVCIVVLFIKLCFFVRRAGDLQHNGITKMNAGWRMYIRNISAQLGIRKEVKAFLSIHIDTPQVIGFLKPVILVPAACLVNLTSQQLEAVLLHELIHIRRNDYLVNMFVASVEILFFFNPFVKQITASIRKEREYSCDDMVMQFQYHPCHYASALLTLEKNRLMAITYGIAASGKNEKQLLTRIERIVGVKTKQPVFYQAGAGLLTLLLLGFIASIHPVKTGIDKFDAGTITFAANNITSLPTSGEAAAHLISATAQAIIPAKTKDIPIPAKTMNSDAVNRYMVMARQTANDDNAAINQVVDAANKETIDFSLSPKEQDDMSRTPDPDAGTGEPYVPANSFSYQFTQDTAMPKIKGETFDERKARETLIKTKKALAAINWKKIEKDLKYSSGSLAKLKKELVLQIQALDWQKINMDVQDELNQQQVQKLQEAVQQDQIIKQYQQSEMLYNELQKQITEQEQIIKTSDQRVQATRKAAQQQQEKLQQEMKKRRIIYI